MAEFNVEESTSDMKSLVPDVKCDQNATTALNMEIISKKLDSMEMAVKEIMNIVKSRLISNPHLLIRVRNRRDNSFLQFKIKKNTPLKKLMNSYCKIKVRMLLTLLY